MLNRFRRLRRAFFELPQQLRLAYCLMRDSRVPLYTKVVFGGGLGIVLSPWFNLPETIPVIGELDTIAVSLLALRLFIAVCPDEVVVELEQQIIEQRSRFDLDVRNGERVATAIYNRFRGDHTIDVNAEPVPSRPERGVQA